MNHRSTGLLAPALAALLSACPAAAQTLHLDGIAALADSLAQAQLASGAIPGMSIAIARNGETVFERGYGRADVEMGVDATPGTVYGITSITKQFTAAMILRLAEAGRISLDDSLSKHLPEFPLQGRHVTLRHLLNHTSGIFPVRGTSAVDDPQWIRRDYTFAEMVELFGGRPFEFEPGTRMEYNNFAYFLLGEVIARVTGTPYGQHVESELAALGLTRTLQCDPRRIIPHRSGSYEFRDGQLTNTRWVSISISGAGGSLCSTVGDLLRWTHLLFGGRVVSPASLGLMTGKTVLAGGDTTDYGFGLYVEHVGTHRKLFHGGTIPWGAYLAHYPDDGLTIAVLTNGAGMRDRAADVEAALARAALGIRVLDLPLAAEDIARYEGAYAFTVGERTLEVRVFGENGQLKAHPAGQGVLRLRAQGGHAFVAEQDDDIRMVFAVQDGRVTGITLHQRGRAIPGVRRP